MKKILFLCLFTLGALLHAQTVYITKTGEKYHVNDCRYLSHSKFSIELSDALNQGYEACKVCRPPQTLTTPKQKANEEEFLQQVPSKNTGSTQCTATTQKGTRCKRFTSSANGMCWQHGG